MILYFNDGDDFEAWWESSQAYLRSTKILLDVGDRASWSLVCYLAHQAIEHSIKTLIVAKMGPGSSTKGRFRTHEISILLKILKEIDIYPWSPDGFEDLSRATKYATVTRYPGYRWQVTMERDVNPLVKLAEDTQMRVSRELEGSATPSR